jgi:hypothetical protein
MLWISGVADLMLMLGVIITIHVSGQSNISAITRLPVEGVGRGGLCADAAGRRLAKRSGAISQLDSARGEDAQSPFLALFPRLLKNSGYRTRDSYRDADL